MKARRRSISLTLLLGLLVPLFATSLAHAGRFKDNKDGTITDKETGLMWEKKLAADGTDGGNCIEVAQYKRDVHCANNLYTWTDPTEGDNTNPDGTVFTDFLSTLNQEATNDRNSTCYANHCDWRLPRLTELRGILAGEYPCSTNPCVDSAFEVIDTCLTLSSTSGVSAPYAVWGVELGSGNVTGAYKDALHCVRAVRNTQ